MFSPTSATLTMPSVRCPQRGLIELPLEHGEGGRAALNRASAIALPTGASANRFIAGMPPRGT
jgi:hypothetical protein